MEAGERIEAILTYYKLNAKLLSEKLGFSRPQAIYDIINGKTKSITEKLAIKIVSVFSDINKIWLLTGEGDMLKSVCQEQSNEDKHIIPLYGDVSTVGGHRYEMAETASSGNILEWIDAGDWFPGATGAIHHYGDSMVEYPSGCILALRRVEDTRLLVNGKNYVIETDEFRVTKQIQYDGGDFLTAYSSNRDTYPDGRLIHSPFKIPMAAIRHIDLVLGAVVKEVSNGPIPVK